jgi:hypothetical protein
MGWTGSGGAPPFAARSVRLLLPLPLRSLLEILSLYCNIAENPVSLSHHNLPVLTLDVALALQPKPLQELVDKLPLRVGEARGEGDGISAAVGPI